MSDEQNDHVLLVGGTYDGELYLECSCGWLWYADEVQMPLAALVGRAAEHTAAVTPPASAPDRPA